MKLSPVKALMRIDHSIIPNTFFVPASEQQREELLSLGAIEDLNEADAALAEKMHVLKYAEFQK